MCSSDLDNLYHNRTPLLLASQNGHAEVARLLIEHNADMEAQDDNRFTSLLLASGGGHVEVARALLDRGADMEAQNDDKRTPLLLALEGGHLEVARALINRGADYGAPGVPHRSWRSNSFLTLTFVYFGLLLWIHTDFLGQALNINRILDVY